MATMNSTSSSVQPFEFDKNLRDSSDKAFVPSEFNFTNDPSALAADSLPVIDFAALIAGDPARRNQAVQDLAGACRDWGFFILINHGMPETLMNETFTAVKEFWELPESEKKQYEAKSASDPIKCGSFTLTTTPSQTFTLWRENIKLFVHPDFHCPPRPQILREVVMEYSRRSREIFRKLMGAISDGLELDQQYVDEVLKLDSSFQMFAANYYPPCPHPDQAIGIPPHTDPGLLSFVINNGVAGLHIMHEGKWIKADSPKNSILVNVANHLEILSNGRYKSVMHRAVVNKEIDRISIVSSNGPGREAVVGPAAPLVEKDGRPMYSSMKYYEYLESQLNRKSLLGKNQNH